MEVFVFVHYHQNKETGEEELLIPEVYATEEKAQERFGNTTVEVLESIDEEEPIIDLTNDPDYFIFNSDWRYICCYYKKVEVKE